MLSQFMCTSVHSHCTDTNERPAGRTSRGCRSQRPCMPRAHIHLKRVASIALEKHLFASFFAIRNLEGKKRKEGKVAGVTIA